MSGAMMLQAGSDMATEGGRIPGLARHTSDLQAIRELAASMQLHERREQIAGGEIARGAEDDESTDHRWTPLASRARLMPLEISPTWLNAWG
jgi:hypothetical protein